MRRNIKGLKYGHVVIKENGKKCTCGNSGCTEMYCSIRTLKERISERKNMQNITGKELLKIMENDMESISDIIEEYINDLAIALSNYINIFEPEAICIGGSFVYYKEILLEKIVNKIKRDNVTYNGTVPQILIAKYGNDSGIIGASLLL